MMSMQWTSLFCSSVCLSLCAETTTARRKQLLQRINAMCELQMRRMLPDCGLSMLYAYRFLVGLYSRSSVVVRRCPAQPLLQLLRLSAPSVVTPAKYPDWTEAKAHWLNLSKVARDWNPAASKAIGKFQPETWLYYLLKQLNRLSCFVEWAYPRLP